MPPRNVDAALAAQPQDKAPPKAPCRRVLGWRVLWIWPNQQSTGQASFLTLFLAFLTLNLSDFWSVTAVCLQTTHPSAEGWRSPQSLGPSLEGPPFLDRTGMPFRSHKAVGQGSLQKTYADEAARLRKLASNVTTARLRSRLLEEAANQEWLARQADGGGASHARARWPRLSGQDRRSLSAPPGH